MTSERLEARIALVDDQEPNIRLLERILAHAGFKDVHTFESGQRFLAAIDGLDPDLVLLDLHMPVMDGFAVLDAIRAGQPDDAYLPVVVLTADSERRARSRALESGANDFLLKPLDAEEVVLRVRNLLATRRLHRALRERNSNLVTEVAAKSVRLATSESEWSDVAAALGRLEALETPELTAAAVCRELASLPDVTMVGISAFGGSGAMIPLAMEGPVSSRFVVNSPLSDHWSSRFRSLVESGTWVGRVSTLADDLGLPEILEEQATGAALVPFGPEGEPLGVLAAATDRPGGSATLARHIHALEAFAAVTGALLGAGITARRHCADARSMVTRVIETAAFRPVFQSIVEVATNRIVGYEALTRFADGTQPDLRFAQAASVGLGPALEAVCLEAALEASRRLPADAWLSVNVSPEMVLAGGTLRDILASTRRNLVVELTEHVPVEDYCALRESIASVGPSIRFAVDDAGAGFSSFRHILELRPDFVKLDIGLVRGVESDPAREAFVAGMSYFAVKTGCQLIAEGVETEVERRQLQQLAVHLGQGYLWGRPAEAARAARRTVPPARTRFEDRIHHTSQSSRSETAMAAQGRGPAGS